MSASVMSEDSSKSSVPSFNSVFFVSFMCTLPAELPIPSSSLRLIISCPPDVNTFFLSDAVFESSPLNDSPPAA